MQPISGGSVSLGIPIAAADRRNTFKFVGGELWHGTALQEKVNSTLERLSAMKGDFAQYCKFTVEAR